MDDMLKRKENESELEYHKRLIFGKLVDKTLADEDYTELSKYVYNKEYSSDVARRMMYGSRHTLELLGQEKENKIIKKQIDNTVEEDNYLKELKEEKRQIKEERYKLQTEKLENNRWIREKARIDLFLEKMTDSVKDLPMFTVPKSNTNSINSLKDGLLPIGDPHFGKKILIKGLKGEILNEYNEEVFQERMWKLFDEVKKIILKENLTHINTIFMGDLIDGILRMNQLQSLEYGITESTMKFSEFIATWLNELSYLVEIDLYSVYGNHSQIRPLGSKNGEFPQENMEKIILWFLKTRLEGNKNITIHINESDFAYIDILGYKVMASHGEEGNIEQAIKDYITMYGEKVDLYLGAHLHSKYEKSVGVGAFGDIEVQRVPSICGADDYSMKLRRSACAAARFFLIESGKGKTVTYDIVLN